MVTKMVTLSPKSLKASRFQKALSTYKSIWCGEGDLNPHDVTR